MILKKGLNPDIAKIIMRMVKETELMDEIKFRDENTDRFKQIYGDIWDVDVSYWINGKRYSCGRGLPDYDQRGCVDGKDWSYHYSLDFEEYGEMNFLDEIYNRIALKPANCSCCHERLMDRGLGEPKIFAKPLSHGHEPPEVRLGRAIRSEHARLCAEAFQERVDWNDVERLDIANPDHLDPNRLSVMDAVVRIQSVQRGRIVRAGRVLQPVQYLKWHRWPDSGPGSCCECVGSGMMIWGRPKYGSDRSRRRRTYWACIKLEADDEITEFDISKWNTGWSEIQPIFWETQLDFLPPYVRPMIQKAYQKQMIFLHWAITVKYSRAPRRSWYECDSGSDSDSDE